MKIPTLAIAAIIPCLLFVSSCRQKGPAEKAGEQMDEAIEEVKDVVNPKGPVEKVGEKVDEALGN
jgi:outer membrane lipoprotein-sorting protein